jgi:hypothetical protein
VRRAIGALAALFLAIQFVRPAIGNPPVVADVEVPREIAQILRKDCYDCHSNETRVPWFDLVEPIYWMVAQDVRQGRQHLNFSLVGNFPSAQQRALLYESINQVRLGAMPPTAYTLIHRSARVTPDELERLERYLAPKAGAYATSPSPSPPLVPSALFPSRLDVRSAPNGVAFVHEYAAWQAISSTERFDNGTLRVVLANDVAIRALDTNRFAPWPDGAAFAKVAWNAVADGSSVVRPGSFRQVEFMVKDAVRYAATQGWGWGRWLSPDLTPYGETPAFTDECTGCHAPMRDDDFVFTMPIRSATARAGLLNTEAAPADDITRHPTAWKVVTVSLDERSATLSTVYGNPAAIDHVRDTGSGPLGPFAPGAMLASVTWSERDDPHWFGARIPGKMVEARVITVGATVDGQPTYDCQDRAAGVPSQREAPCRREAVDAMLAIPLRR